jgi:hypothetical protein
MVCNSYTAHTIGNSLIDQAGDTRLTVKDRILGMYMKMNEILH